MSASPPSSSRTEALLPPDLQRQKPRPINPRRRRKSVFETLAVLAALFALATYAFGDMALEIAESTGWSSETAEIHEHLGMATTAFLVVWALLRLFVWLRKTALPGWARGLLPVVELGGAAAVLATAFFGGQLVYALGVNVAHM